MTNSPYCAIFYGKSEKLAEGKIGNKFKNFQFAHETQYFQNKFIMYLIDPILEAKNEYISEICTSKKASFVKSLITQSQLSTQTVHFDKVEGSLFNKNLYKLKKT